MTVNMSFTEIGIWQNVDKMKGNFKDMLCTLSLTIQFAFLLLERKKCLSRLLTADDSHGDTAAAWT
jgi:hypothetical protein